MSKQTNKQINRNRDRYSTGKKHIFIDQENNEEGVRGREEKRERGKQAGAEVDRKNVGKRFRFSNVCQTYLLYCFLIFTEVSEVTSFDLLNFFNNTRYICTIVHRALCFSLNVFFSPIHLITFLIELILMISFWKLKSKEI